MFSELSPTNFYDIHDHAYGKHGAYKGQKYRRGKNRCHFCGAPNNALGGWATEQALTARTCNIFYVPLTG